MSYRTATFHVYSGTGNSRRMVMWLAEAVRADGTAVSLWPTTLARTMEIGKSEEALLGLVMPAHGFTAPCSMLRFVLSLPRREETHAIVVATRGALKIGALCIPGFEGRATLLMALILAVKGYRIRGSTGINMPSNWISLHPSLPPRAAQGILDRARVRTARFGTSILSGKRCLWNWPISLLGLLLLPISLAYVVIGRFFLAKLFFASNRCIGCGSCAAHCPQPCHRDAR